MVRNHRFFGPVWDETKARLGLPRRPDRYRGAIIDLVAAHAYAHATPKKMGPDYAIEAKSLERPVEWSRASLTEVFPYVPYSYDVVPKGR